jgi:hypothetical protein
MFEQLSDALGGSLFQPRARGDRSEIRIWSLLTSRCMTKSGRVRTLLKTSCRLSLRLTVIPPSSHCADNGYSLFWREIARALEIRMSTVIDACRSENPPVG